MILMLVATGIFFGGVFGWKGWSDYQSRTMMASMGMPAVTVSTTGATAERWTPVIPAVGTLRASQGVDITAQAAGMIVDLRFESGATVQAGDLLAQQYVEDEGARLAALEADVRLAELNLARAKDLLDQNLNSQFEFDTRKTDRDRAVAQANNVRLIIEKKTIRAPFAGRIGIRQVDLGEYIEPGDPIVRLEALDQIRVDLPVSQRSIGKIRIGQPFRVFVDAWPDKGFPGAVTAIAPNVNISTRDVSVEGLVDNPGEQLLPGMFVVIEIELPAKESVVTLPQSAITFSPYGDSVYIVRETTMDGGDAALIVENTFVQTGERRGDQVAIRSGVAAGDQVVSAGQNKLRNGALVVIDNSVIVSNEAFSVPENN
jgi:membrane fusion protein (multidrug efflux system)